MASREVMKSAVFVGSLTVSSDVLNVVAIEPNGLQWMVFQNWSSTLAPLVMRAWCSCLGQHGNKAAGHLYQMHVL